MFYRFYSFMPPTLTYNGLDKTLENYKLVSKHKRQFPENDVLYSRFETISFSAGRHLY
jgi:hypothetical protein